jgi:hypothetical protein
VPSGNASVLEGKLLAWQVGETMPLALRQGREINMRLEKSGNLRMEDHLAPRGAYRMVIDLQEGEREGRAIFHLGEDFVSGGWLRVDQMLPGVGTIFMDYLTTLAQFLGRRRDFVAIQNPKIFHIIDRSALIVAEDSWIEAYTPSGTDPDGYDLAGRAPYAEHVAFRANNPYASFFTVRGRPDPRLSSPSNL